MRFNNDVLRRYVQAAPLPLAIERAVECHIYAGRSFERPILDVGCGEGLFASILFAEKIDTGIDPNARELERAAELGAYHELIQCYGDAVPKPDGSYRTVFSNSVLEHIVDVRPVFREVYRLLAPGGRFYISVPSDRFDQYSVVNQVVSNLGLHRVAQAYRSWFNGFWRHYHHYSVEGWSELASESGFVVDEAFAYDPPSTCLLNDALVPFSAPGLVMKKLANRWIAVPPVRRAFASVAAPLLSGIVEKSVKSDVGGLVFLEMRKP